jgi:hypothetical protein
MPLDFNRDAFDEFIAQYPALRKRAAFYAEFAIAVHEICKDPDLGLKGNVRDIEWKYDGVSHNLECIVSGNGWEFHFLVAPLQDGQGFSIMPRATNGPHYQTGPTYELASGISALKKDDILGLLHTPRSYSQFKGSLKQTLAHILKAGLKL